MISYLEKSSLVCQVKFSLVCCNGMEGRPERHRDLGSIRPHILYVAKKKEQERLHCRTNTQIKHQSKNRAKNKSTHKQKFTLYRANVPVELFKW